MSQNVTLRIGLTERWYKVIDLYALKIFVDELILNLKRLHAPESYIEKNC